MSFLLRTLLRVLHFFYHIFTLIASWKSLPHPQELSYPRKQTPRHLALLLASDGRESASADAVLECYLESVRRAVGWCRTVGIRKLTAYDRDGTPSN
jgi:dehydrodolichyl diphosphate syntase complex subunit NUS1